MAKFFNDLNQESELLRIIGRAATRQDNVHFADLLWTPPAPGELLQQAMAAHDVLFCSEKRLFALGIVQKELRYYAGPTPTHLIEPFVWELGVLKTVRDGLLYAVQFLVEERPPDAITLARKIVGK